MPLLRILFRPWKNAPLDQLASSVIVGFLIFLCAMVLHIGLAFNPLIERMTSDVVVTAFLNPTMDPEQEDKVVDTIRTSLAAPDREIQHLGVDGFVAQLEKTYPDLARQVNALGGDVHSVVPRYVSLSGSMGADVLESLERIPGVEKVESSKGRFASMTGTLKALQWLTRLVGMGLLFSLLVGFWHLARIHRSQQSETFKLIQSLGASRFQIRLLSAGSVMTVGLLGAGVAWAGLTFLNRSLLGRVSELAPWLGQLSLSPSVSFSLGLLGLCVVLSASAGWIAGRPPAR